MSSPITTPRAAATAWIIGLSHLLLTVLIQIENYLFYVESSSLLDSFLELLQLPFIQLENLIAAILLGFLVFFLLAAGFRWSALVLVSVCNLYLIVDQLAYKFFYDHLSLQLFDAEPSLWQLFIQLSMHKDFIAVINLLLWLGITWFLFKSIFDGCPRKVLVAIDNIRIILAKNATQVALAVFIGASVILTSLGGHFNLQYHAIFALFSLSFPPSLSNVEINNINNVFSPRFGGLEQHENDHEQMTARANIINKSESPKNIVILSLQLPPITEKQRQELYERLKGMYPSHIYSPYMYHSFPTVYHAYQFASWPSLTAERSKLTDREYSPLAQQLVTHGYATVVAAMTEIIPQDLAQHGKNLSFNLSVTEMWGKPVRQKVDLKTWLSDPQTAKQPVFLQVLRPLTSSSAVNVMADAAGSFQELFSLLQDTNRFRDTLFFIEGFSPWQDGVPGFALSEQFTRGFLFLTAAHYSGPGIIDNRPITFENLTETIKDLAAIPSKNADDNFLDSDFRQRVIYFLDPRQSGVWGLRDGRWKFLSSTLGNKAFLYDIERDPEEKENLAARYPKRIKLYEKMSAKWYEQYPVIAVQENSHFLPGQALRKRRIETGVPGPKALTFGLPEGSENENKLTARTEFNPYDAIAAYIRWIDYGHEKTVTLDWVSPQGQHYASPFTLQAGWTGTWVTPPMGLPMEEGGWSLILANGERPLLARDFVVNKNVPMHRPLSTKLAALEQIATGVYAREGGEKKFAQLAELSPLQRPVIWTRWRRERDVRLIKFRWQSPSGVVVEDAYGLRGDWEETWVDYEGKMPLEPGEWQVSIWQGNTLLKEISFSVMESIKEAP